MLFDTDVLIWAFRGDPSAQKEIDNDDSRLISMVTYMELIQVARNKTEQMQIKNFLRALEFGHVLKLGPRGKSFTFH